MGYYGNFRHPIPHLGVRSIALLTLSPLALAGTFDLHVLAMPPAFNLSHDQTLQLISLIPSCEGWISREEDHVTPRTHAFRHARGAVSAGYLRGEASDAHRPAGRWDLFGFTRSDAPEFDIRCAVCTRVFRPACEGTGPTICSTLALRLALACTGLWTDYLDRAVALRSRRWPCRPRDDTTLSCGIPTVHLSKS